MHEIIFDLFGTLIEKEQYDYDKALNWLADSYFKHRFQELQELSSIFKKSYMEKRRVSCIESSFKDQLIFFEKELGIHIPVDYGTIEVDFINHFRKEKLIDGAAELLQYLHNKNYRIFILSNSLFSGSSLKAYLDSFNISHYVEKVYSSADIGYRKPSCIIFQTVLHDLGIHNPDRVFYIGDSLEKDFLGAMKSGLTPILVSHTSTVDGLSFANLYMLLEYFKSLD